MQREIRAFVLAQIRNLDFEVDDEVDDDTPLDGRGLGMESLFVMEVVMKVEQEYGITLADDPSVIQEFTIGKLVRRVVDHRSAVSGGGAS